MGVQFKPRQLRMRMPIVRAFYQIILIDDVKTQEKLEKSRFAFDENYIF